MADVNFYLEKRRDKETGALITKNVPIFLFYTFGKGLRLQYYTGLRIDSKEWNTDKGFAKGNSIQAIAINESLKRLRDIVETAHSEARINGTILTGAYFRNRLTGKTSSGNDSIVKRSFEEAFQEYIRESKLTRKASTIKGIESSINVIKEFAKSRQIPLSFEAVTMDFYNSFLDWSFNDKGYKNNHTGKLIKVLKAFLNWAADKGYHQTMDFKKKSFKKLTEEPEIIFLKYEELIQLYGHPFEEEHLRRIRDVFCFGCFTGLRFSDIKNLRPENVVGDMLVFRVIKTGEQNTVPLNQFSSEIIKRYEGQSLSFPIISEQKTNDYLKDVLEKAKLNRKVQLNHFQGAKRITKSLPLYQVVTFHVSKKTFMTNFLAKGGSLHTAMAITGNKSFKTAKRYFSVVDSLKQEEMKKVFG